MILIFLKIVGKFSVIGMHEGRLQEIYAVCDGQIRQLTHFNDDILKDKYVADYEYYRLSLKASKSTAGY